MTPQPIRIFLVDDNVLYAESVAAVLGTDKDFKVVGLSRTASEARPLISKSAPDIVLVELHMSGQSGLDLLRDLPGLSVRSRAIATAEEESREEIVEAMRLGAKGFVLKQTGPELFMKCLRKVYEGEIWLDGRFAEAVMHAFGTIQAETKGDGKNEISAREMEVIALVVQGYKNRDIAQKLFISEKTVKNHLSAIFNKLGVADRLELTLYVFEKRMFSPTME
ncbi:MAG: response regulator transcription factor [Acidobacteria bacterium]|nr:response regulator transcription factor [Acidobacteriota bacterium]